MNPRLMSTRPFTVKYGPTSAAKKTQTESPNLDYSNLDYLIPGHINRWEGTFKPLTQRRLVSLNQRNFYQILHSAPSSRGNLGGEGGGGGGGGEGRGGAEECFRRSPTRNDTNSSRSDRSRHKMTAGKGAAWLPQQGPRPTR